MDAREIADQLLDVGRAGDADWFLSVMAPDAVIEWPYRPEGVPERLTGREEIRAFMGTEARVITFESYRDKVIHETTDPEVVIIEYTAHGQVTATGAPFTQRVIAVIRVRDGFVVHYRDYINPLPLMAALGSSAR
ncbi:nuclear transport factor 2 family protein [Nonomuraea rhizosphaerae]|uniref:nuclear transport factor 2 family protein n=1 Tax=Nonomuraea rhizosphaerae TaxID=2665663 RepID=UPI001C5CF9CC|nr:nuclear transport factor 2 family protein [Nonomuraea rhizosphaerae]